MKRALAKAIKDISPEQRAMYAERLIRGVTDEKNDPTQQYNAVALDYVRKIQALFDGTVIRRDGKSKDYKGDRINDLEDYNDRIAFVRLYPAELDALDNAASRIRAGAISTGIIADGSKFFMDIRKGLGHISAIGLGRTGPVFTTMEAFKRNKSSKIERSAQMIRHILRRDDAPEIEFTTEGEVTFPPLPQIPEGQPEPGRTNQVLVYCEFAALIPCVVSVYRLFGIKCLWIDGNIPVNTRQERIDRFRAGKDERVMIMSAVGMTGLNLSCANFVIFFDQPWSSQDEEQFIGRAWRPPQKKQVWVYHLIALGTTDVLMCGMARGKSAMLDEFLQRKNAP
ncbi:P-loop containing nucleoside triphosphate hydrolase protein, partial [Rickenella mellea]